MDFQGVVAILDEAIGGPGVGIGAHRAFWRDISRDEFVAKKVSRQESSSSSATEPIRTWCGR